MNNTEFRGIADAYVNERKNIGSDVYYQLWGENSDKYEHVASLMEYWTDSIRYVCIVIDEDETYDVLSFYKNNLEWAETFRNYKDAKKFFKEKI